MIKTHIVGTGAYFPEKRLSSSELAEKLGKTADWIVSRTGIHERRIADRGAPRPNAALGSMAAKEALSRAELSINDIDQVILCTATPDGGIPSSASFLLRELAPQKNIPCLDINAACAGFVYGLSYADALIQSKQAKRVLLIGSEVLSRLVDWTDPGTCIIFGDGAGAVILEGAPATKILSQREKAHSRESGILSHHIYSDTSLTDILYIDLPEPAQSQKIMMNGREVFRHAVTRVTEAIHEALKHNELTAADIDHLIPHQANIRIVDAIGDNLKIPKERVVLNLEHYGNTSAASIPTALHGAIASGRIKRGDLVCMAALGAGLSYGATLLRY